MTTTDNKALADRLRKMADECESSEDGDTGLPGTFLKQCSGFVHDDLTEAARIIAPPQADKARGEADTLRSFVQRLECECDPDYGHRCARCVALYAAPQPKGDASGQVPDDECVICPSCTQQFRAIPAQVQSMLMAHGERPPFLATPQARPDGGIDGCTESNCPRCLTAPHARGDMQHAGIGSYPTPAPDGEDEWHEAVVAECFRIAGGYYKDDPTKTLRAIEDWWYQLGVETTANGILGQNAIDKAEAHPAPAPDGGEVVEKPCKECGGLVHVWTDDDAPICLGCHADTHPTPVLDARAVAYVPVHPKNGPLWAMTTSDPSPERLPSYPLRPLFDRPTPAPDVARLVNAARPFDALFQPDNVGHMEPCQPDKQGIFGVNGAAVTLGDLRRLREALAPFTAAQQGETP